MSNCSIWSIKKGRYQVVPLRTEWTWERWEWKNTSHSSKLKYDWSLTIWLFNVISRTLVGVGVLQQRCSQCIIQLQPTGLPLSWGFFFCNGYVSRITNWEILKFSSTCYNLNLIFTVHAMKFYSEWSTCNDIEFPLFEVNYFYWNQEILPTCFKISGSANKTLFWCIKMIFFMYSYLSHAPPNGWVWHNAFFKVGPGTGLWPKYTCWGQKCLGSHRHSLKKRCLR